MSLVAQALSILFLTMASTIYLINSFASLRSRFVEYGPRSRDTSVKQAARGSQSILASLLDWAASWSVPHAAFLHFYVASVLSSLFWGITLFFWSTSLSSSALLSHDLGGGASMTPEQVSLAWLLMTTQGLRRLYECIALPSSSTSRMWIGHWILGVVFYLMVNVSIWVEGIDAVETGIPLPSLALLRPSFKLLVGVPLFLMASGIQHDCHVYLSKLKKYTVPQHPAFQQLIAPHYLAECVIYLALAIVAAPQSKAINQTMVCALTFVAVNLGVTAGNTRIWYESKFGKESVAHRWNMIPLIY